MDRVRPPLRRHRRPRPAGRPRARRTVRLSAGHAVDHHRCGLGGAVQDFVILFASMRRDGKSLGQMAREEIGNVGGFVALSPCC